MISPTKSVLLSSLLVSLAAFAGAAPTDGEKLFALKVKPLFAEKCMACHGDEPEKLKGEFDMRTREALLKGGETFGDEVLIPGKGTQSYLYITTTRTEEDYEMPPKEADKLTEEQTWWIRDWIDAGAPWLDDEQVASIQSEYAEGEKVAVSKALSDDWQHRRYQPEKLWAYRKLQVTIAPESAHPVDAFIGTKLAAAGLEAAPPATAREMVRRMRFGLTGLPPSPDEVARFESAYAKDAAVRRTLRQPLARRRPLRRQRRLRQRLRPPERLALPRLRGARVQQRQALRPVRARADRR
jgi:mono/diheme cytochrome c family protein